MKIHLKSHSANNVIYWQKEPCGLWVGKILKQEIPNWILTRTMHPWVEQSASLLKWRVMAFSKWRKSNRLKMLIDFKEIQNQQANIWKIFDNLFLIYTKLWTKHYECRWGLFECRVGNISLQRETMIE